MSSSSPIFANLPDPVKAIWQDVTNALQTGDLGVLKTALQDYMVLDTSDQVEIEQLATLLPFPGLPPQLIAAIFSNPGATIGVIDRLQPVDTQNQDTSAASTELGIVERAIVMDALITWLQSQSAISQNIAQSVSSSSSADGEASRSQDVKSQDAKSQDVKNQEVKREDAKHQDAQRANSSTASNDQDNPVNRALTHYLQSPRDVSSGSLNLSSLQFLKTNPITLLGLQLANPELLNDAFQVAAGQLLLSLASQVNPAATASDLGNNQTQAAIIQQNLLQAIKKALEEQAIPLNPQVFLVLLTVMTMPSLQLANNQSQNANTTVTSGVQSVVGAATPVFASVVTAIPQLFESEGINLQSGFVQEIALLSVVYTQMAPYWMAPGAVSLMKAAGGTASDASKTEASVRAYAIGLAAFMNDPSFTNLLTAIIKLNMPNITAEQLNMFISAMKISILTNALVALYITLIRKTQGQFSAQELADMILGKVPLPPDDLEAGLIKSIQAELQNIPVDEHESFINNLLSQYGANTDVSALIDPTNQLLSLCDPSFLMSITSHTAL